MGHGQGWRGQIPLYQGREAVGPKAKARRFFGSSLLLSARPPGLQSWVSLSWGWGQWLGMSSAFGHLPESCRPRLRGTRAGAWAPRSSGWQPVQGSSLGTHVVLGPGWEKGGEGPLCASVACVVEKRNELVTRAPQHPLQGQRRGQAGGPGLRRGGRASGTEEVSLGR